MRKSIRPGPLLALVIVIVCLRCDIYRAWYERELEEVKREFEKIDGVRVVAAGGNEDVTLEDLYAHVRLTSGETLHFQSITPQAFTGKQPFSVAQVADMFPRVVIFGYTGVIQSATGKPVQSVGVGNSFEVGSGGEIALCCDSVRSIPEFIANIDSIKAELQGWPRCPAWNERMSPYGDVYRYCIADSTDDPGPDVPKRWLPFK